MKSTAANTRIFASFSSFARMLSSMLSPMWSAMSWTSGL